MSVGFADAILADLETSATPRNIYENRWETQTTTEHATVSPLASRVLALNRSQELHSPDPALLALPANDSLDGLLDPKEYYRARSPGQPVYSSTITISKSVYNTDGNDDDGCQRSQSVSPSPSRFNHTSQSAKSQFQTAPSAIQQLSPNVPKPSRLSNNLSELDSLLDDISSAKFYTEVDKTSQNTLGNHRISPQPSGTLGSRPTSRTGTLQRDQEIPKLIVPTIQPNANYGNYDDFDSCQGTQVLQGSYLPQQSSVASYSVVTGTSQNRTNGFQDNVVPTNVQRPPVHQLHQDQSGDQYVVGAAGATFQVQQPGQQQPFQVQQQHQSMQQVQQLQPRQLPDALETQQHGQTVIQGQGQDQEEYDLLGPGDYKQTVTECYTEERTANQQPSLVNLPPQQHFTNQATAQQQQAVLQPLQQQQQRLQLATGQPLQPVEQHQQVIIHETVTARGPPGAGLPPGRALSASKDLEELMASFSEFDMSKGGMLGGEPLYAQPVKTIQVVPVIPTGAPSGDSADAGGAARLGNSQEQFSGGCLSVSQSGHGGVGGAPPGSASPGPHEMIIQPSPSTLGHPVPSTMYSQGQSTSKMVVTQGMHGVLPQGGGGGGGGSGQVGDRQLETMLNQLDSDLNQQGILTLPKGDCAACKKAVVGQVLMALGKIWHPEHFVCGHCKQELGTNIFFERDGVPYCENDYQILFSPKCALCGGAILEKCITALNKTWHPEHFFCAQCQRPFGDEGFHEQDGMPYCRDDYFCTFAPKCGGCGNAILSNYFTALQRQWHPECFVCRECYAPFESGSFFDHNGLPYCEQHFHARRGSLCAACQQPILGRCITAMSCKFHPEHFVCVFCLQPLNKGTFKEQSGKPYCHPCFEKLFG